MELRKIFHRYILNEVLRWRGQLIEYDRQLLLSKIKHGLDVRLKLPLTIYNPECIVIGNNVVIGEYSVIRASGKVTIGNNVLIAANTIITTREHPINIPRYGITIDKEITIEDEVWIGAGAILLPGVRVGKGAIVAAGAVVTKNVEPNTIVAGVPAKKIRNINN
jgi:acetyltransferase-like isoleucine patch superfamily enzyme